VQEAKTTTIDLLRHGEPEGGIQLRGWKDDPLSSTGWQQMRSAVGEAAQWQCIVTSPMTRCCELAAEVAERLDVDLIVDERLKEIGFGDWEGRTPAELYEHEPDRLSAFWQDPVGSPPPKGEPMLQFQARVEAAWQDIQAQHVSKSLLVVAHGGVNRLIIRHVLGMPLSHLFRLDVPYAGMSRICIDDGLPRLVSHCGGPYQPL